MAHERFFEFAVHVFLEQQDLPSDVVEQVWKPVTSSTERQLGAFMFLYASAFKKQFATPVGRRAFEQMASTQNDVVHKGMLPSRSQAFEYMQDVFEIIISVQAELKSYAPRAVEQIELRAFSKAHTALEQKAGALKPVLLAFG